MSGRTYLSIGDVLTLLRAEFPDVTISKIRFLESQGLVNPERSPSGYRKFFEPDVERLRFVLRQQREHFLPLKVIRDRLAAGDLGDISEAETAGAPTAHQNGAVPQPVHAHAGSAPAGSGPSSRSAAERPAGPAARPSRTEAQSAKADDEAMARILADASRRAALIPDAAAPAARGPQERGGLRVVPDPPAGGGEADRDGAPVTGDAPNAGRPVAARSAAAGTRSGAAKTPPSGPTGSSVGQGAGGRPASSEPDPGPARAFASAATARPSKGADIMVTGASLSAEELCGASGLSAEELAGLQGFGLVEPMMVAGIPTFDEDALAVASLAAEFRKFGIEPRHLRQYRNAVDREIGLIEQVIIPLLRQRNPEARQRALDSSQELASLGEGMRATLLRSALRRHIGG